MKRSTRMAVLTVWLFVFASCVTEKGARRYMNEHDLFAAKYCADKFPVIPSVKIDSTGDSTKYLEAYRKLMAFADSVMRARAPQLGTAWNNVSGLDRARDSIKLRQALSEELKRALTPCVDRIIRQTNTVVDSARMKELQLITEGARADKEKYVNLYASQVEKTNQEAGLKRRWMIGAFILVSAGVLYFLLRLRGVIR